MTSISRPFPLPLTRKQWFYLCVIQGLGAGIIDGGANFGIAYAMYHNQHVVKMWVFKENTIAGDLGVTPIIQCLASMLITSTLVHTDLHHHAIKPLAFVYPHVQHLPDPRSLFRPSPTQTTASSPSFSEKPTSSLPDTKGPSYYLKMLIRFIFEGTENNMLAHKSKPTHWLCRFAWTAAQGAALGIVFGFPIWCLAMIILGPIYGNGNMGNKWAPQVIKLIYGAVVGWVTNPVIAILALGSQADHSLLIVEEDVEREAGVGVGGDDNRIGVPERVEAEVLDQSLGRRLDEPPAIPNMSMRTSGSSVAPLRIRAESYTSRPPLTANVSTFSPAPLGTPIAVAPQRPRGFTMTSAAGESSRSFSYTLSGTGGRAQRPRASTRASLADTYTMAPVCAGT